MALGKSKPVEEEQRMRCLKQDVIALVVAILIFILIVVLALASTIFPSAPALPSFDDPIKGFEPRGTDLSNRINTIKTLSKQKSLTTVKLNQGQQSPSVSRKRRSKTSTSCQVSYGYDARLVFEAKSSGNLLTADNLKSMCYLEKRIMISTPSKYGYYYYQGCSSISLGGFAAQLANKTCETIDDADVTKALNVLQSCSTYFSRGTLTQGCYCDDPDPYNKTTPNCPTVPCHCSLKRAVYLIMNYLTDSEFLKTPNQTKLKYSATLSPIQWNSYDLFKYIYESKLIDSLPEHKGVKVVGFDFANFRFDLFNILLVENAKYPGIAMAFVLVIMCFFLKSFILAFSAMLTVIFALVLSYFLYMVVFGIKFFPFLNVVTLVFLVGIGADDAFVYYDIFRQTKSANPNDSIVSLTLKTLRYAALSMFVTSFTTSAAFFANLTSHITSIKAFGIYAGLSILTNYLLMITWFPIIVMLHERWVRKRKVDQTLQLANKQGGIKVSSNVENDPGEDEPKSEEISNRDGNTPRRDGNVKQSLACLICWGIDFPCHFISRYNTFFSSKSAKLFDTWLPNAILKKRLYFLWIVLFVGLTIGFSCISFVSPGLRLPTSKEFQVFSSSSTIEQYNLHIKEKFRYASANRGGMRVDLVWGVKPVDNGNYLDPDNKGTLEFDNSFDQDLTSFSSQRWLSSFCKSLSQHSFYTQNEDWKGGSLCAVEKIRKMCSGPRINSCCKNETFPFTKGVFESCLQTLWQRPTIYYDKTSGKAKAMIMEFHSNVIWTAEYEKMDKFWNQILSWSEKQIAEAPTTPLKNGWIVCRYIDQMYSLQYSLQKGTVSSMGVSIGIAFGVMLLTTLNIFISMYAIVTIVGILAMTVGSLVLLGWQLSVLESIVFSVSVGLSIDFTMHYGVAYRLSPHKDNRHERVRYSFIHIGSAILMAAFTTFVTGLLMLPAIVLVYIQLGQFLILVMVFSWLFATFAFLSLSAFIGPVGNFGQLSITRLCRKCGFCKVKPEEEMSLQKRDACCVTEETQQNDNPDVKVEAGHDNVQNSHL